MDPRARNVRLSPKSNTRRFARPDNVTNSQSLRKRASRTDVPGRFARATDGVANGREGVVAGRQCARENAPCVRSAEADREDEAAQGADRSQDRVPHTGPMTGRARVTTGGRLRRPPVERPTRRAQAARGEPQRPNTYRHKGPGRVGRDHGHRARSHPPGPATVPRRDRSRDDGCGRSDPRSLQTRLRARAHARRVPPRAAPSVRTHSHRAHDAGNSRAPSARRSPSRREWK